MPTRICPDCGHQTGRPFATCPLCGWSEAPVPIAKADGRCMATKHGERSCSTAAVPASRFCEQHQYCGREATTVPPWIAAYLQHVGISVERYLGLVGGIPTPDGYCVQRAVERWIRGEGKLESLVDEEYAADLWAGKLDATDKASYARCKIDLAEWEAARIRQVAKEIVS